MSPEATAATHNERARCAQLVINYFLDASADEAQATAQPLVAAILRPEAGNQLTPALLDVVAERARQISAEGWSPEHDDQHTNWELARAGACYAAGGGLFRVNSLQVPQQVWPYQWEFNPKDRRRDLVRGAALILAEIERIDRATAGTSLGGLPSTEDAYAAMSWGASLRGTAAPGATIIDSTDPRNLLEDE